MLSQGQVQPNLFAAPGNTEAVLFEATNRLTGFQGNQIWMGATGVSDNWGSCNVLVSQDGTTYLQVGTIDTQARLGALHSTFATGSDPDTVNSLIVDMAENSPALDAGATADADQGNTLCYVDGELLSYSACTVTGQDQYTMGTYIRRAQRGSTVGSHAAASLFLRLDNAVFKYTYDPSWAGKTIYIKFQSVNSFGNSAQDPSTITPVTFTIPGVNGGTVDAGSGLVIGAPNTGVPPVSAPTAVTNIITTGGALSQWTAGNTLVVPGSLEFDVQIAGGIVDVLLFASTGSPGPNGYILRLDGRSTFHAGQILKVTAGTWANIGSFIAAANSGSLSGWHTVHVTVSSGGRFDIYVDGAWQCTATDTTFTPTGAVYIGYEVTGGATIAPVGFTQKTLDNTVDGSTYVRPGYVNADHSYHVSTPFNAQGSVIPTQTIATPTWTTTTTTIVLSWSSSSMLLADGSTASISSGTKTYSSLSANTKYYLYPYVRVSDGTIQFANGTPPPTAADATSAINACSDGRYTLVPFNVTTPASGTGGGGGGIGCPESAELVEVQGKGPIPVGQVMTGDMIKGYSFESKADVYRKVISVRTDSCIAWRVVNGHKVSPCEPVWDGQSYTPAFRIPGAAFDPSLGVKVSVQVLADEFEECNYWLTGGVALLTHNFYPPGGGGGGS